MATSSRGRATYPWLGRHAVSEGGVCVSSSNLIEPRIFLTVSDTLFAYLFIFCFLLGRPCVSGGWRILSVQQLEYIVEGGDVSHGAVVAYFCGWLYVVHRLDRSSS